MSVSITGALIISILGLLIFNIHPTDQPYIIHYKAISGIDLFGSWWNLYFLGLMAVVLLVFHLLLAKFFWQRIRTLSYFLLFITPILEIIILINVVSLIKINR